jgi:hypothetical protein
MASGASSPSYALVGKASADMENGSEAYSPTARLAGQGAAADVAAGRRSRGWRAAARALAYMSVGAAITLAVVLLAGGGAAPQEGIVVPRPASMLVSALTR